MQRYDELLTVGEVAARLSCSTATVWRRLSNQQIPTALRIAGSTRWRSIDIDNFITQKAIEAGLEPAPISSERS